MLIPQEKLENKLPWKSFVGSFTSCLIDQLQEYFIFSCTDWIWVFRFIFWVAWWSHWLQEYLIWLCWPAQCTRPSRSWRTSLRARSSYPRTSKSSLRRLAGSGPVHIETGFSYNWKTLKNFVENYSHWLRGTSSCLRYASPVCERWVSACLWICIHMNCRDIWFTNDLTSNDG